MHPKNWMLNYKSCTNSINLLWQHQVPLHCSTATILTDNFRESANLSNESFSCWIQIYSNRLCISVNSYIFKWRRRRRRMCSGNNEKRHTRTGFGYSLASGMRLIEIQNNKIIEASNRLTYKQTQYILSLLLFLSLSLLTHRTAW